ncbi:MAG TPA: DUF1295 domain-containing protein [Opitutaceae bacterium]
MNGALLGTLSLATLAAAFEGLRRWAIRLNNFSIVDAGWTYGFLLVAGLAASLECGWARRRCAVFLIVAAWSLRLGTHLARRIAAHHPREDSRYAELRRNWGPNFRRRMAGFFQLQAASVVIFSLPFFLSCRDVTPRWHVSEWLGLVIWLAGWLGESAADRQLARFKSDPTHRGQVCDAGLWSLSRHPNYFFEFVVWIGFAAFASSAPWGWLGVISPLCILGLLLRVTGIPMAEQQSLRSKGDAYRQYQRRTRAFVPWPKRRRP